ncbi:tetratricopeptide repeat protein [Elioraea sp.]|uniref:tetratricopeptide repeat protein n=1 Tax=Elioraea sp. TaxID=2185103 RepID=UPI0026143490|nr:tetratricopeptide repeat protein [Elioraea sp.]
MRSATPAALLLMAAPGCAVIEGLTPAETAPDPAPDAADRARAEALYREGLRALNPPRGGTRDPDRAARLIAEAAHLGHPEAQMLLAASHLYRPDGSRDPEAAIPWLERAAMQGHVEAQYQLARLIEAGEGTAREPAWAAMWFRRAAERGSPAAQFALALMQIAGAGTPRDEAEALARLRLAERGGVAAARRYRAALERRVDAAAAEAAWTRVQRERARGPVPAVDRPLVRFAQSTLAAAGYDPGPVDGHDGPRTRAALAAFARAEGIAGAAPYGPAMIGRLRARAR